MRAIGQAHRARGARDLFHDDDVREIAEIGAAPALRNRDAEQAGGAELRPQVAREFVASGRSPSARGAMRSRAKRRAWLRTSSTIRAQAEVEIAAVECAHGCSCRLPSNVGLYYCPTIMPLLESKVDRKSADFAANDAAMRALVGELRARHAKIAAGRRRRGARQARGARKIAAPRSRGNAAGSGLAVPRALAARGLRHVRG